MTAILVSEIAYEWRVPRTQKSIGAYRVRMTARGGAEIHLVAPAEGPRRLQALLTKAQRNWPAKTGQEGLCGEGRPDHTGLLLFARPGAC